MILHKKKYSPLIKGDSNLSPNKVTLIKFKKNKLAVLGLFILIILTLFAFFASFITKYDPNEIDLYNIASPPSNEHILGTDDLGRDVFARLLYGGRVSLMVGIMSTIIQLFIGVFLGSIAGYYGGFIDHMVMRFVDIIMCFPFFVVAISIASITGPSLWNLIIIISLLTWTSIARIVRAEILSLKEREFIEAARALGLNGIEIIIKHLLPNTLSPILVAATLSIADGILIEAALSFLGMGVRPPMASWGNMLSAAQSMRSLQFEWWLWLPPGLMVFSTVFSINFLGDGLRDALDPKIKA